MSKRRYIIPVFIPHRGCPHKCSFCNQREITGGGDNKESVEATIEKYLNIYPKSVNKLEVAFYGGSFTGLSRQKQIELLKPAYIRKKRGYINDIRISTRPDYIDGEIISLLTEYGVSIIELGIQSTDKNVLSLNKRGHSRGEIFDAYNLLRKYPFKIGLQMMVGLLGDSENTVLTTAREIAYLKPDFVRIYPTIVLKNTLLGNLYKKGEFTPFSFDKTVDICKELLSYFINNNIPVIRLGLQSTEEINYNKAIVAGPYHPAFREIVESEIYKDIIEKKLIKLPLPNKKRLLISCHPEEVSKVIGHKKSNKKYFIDRYNLENITIKQNRNLDEYLIELDIL